MSKHVVGSPRGLSSALFVGVVALGVAAWQPTAKAAQVPAAPNPAAHGPHWSYEGAEAPPHWAELSPEFASCGVGHQQSPIDIVTSAATPLLAGTAGFDAVRLGPATEEAVPVDIVNNGHTVEVDAVGSGVLVIGNDRYVLQQFHFHSPSEHTVDGRYFPLEAHLVHKGADGRLAVVGVLFEEGAENPALTPFWKSLPKSASAPVDLGRGNVSIGTLLPPRHDVYRYAGSLTTPPCSEAVKWFVMKDHVPASAAQIGAMRAIIKGNNRPVQTLNGRTVYTDAIR